MPEGRAIGAAPAKNVYQARTSPRKLRGGYYSPIDLARLILARLRLRPDDLVLDPACGDGSFLEAALAEGATHVVGLDVDPDAAREARARLGVKVRVGCADALAWNTPEEAARAAGIALPSRGRLLVVGNPPYVEAKRLPRETKRALAERFPEALDGAPDLYLYFLHACLRWLGPRDRLAFVLPNKVLVNANAQRVREVLLDTQRLRGLWLATRAGLFPGAAVYPVVLFAGAGRGEIETATLGRNKEGVLRVESRDSVHPRQFAATASRALYPPPSGPALAKALARLLASRHRLGDVLDIRWTVSFHRAGLRGQYVTRDRPEGPCARRFLGGGAFSGNAEVTRFRLRWGGWWIRYDEAELARLKNSVPDEAIFRAPKIAICQNGRTIRAAFDEEGLVLKDTFLAGLPCAAEHPLVRHPRAIVGLLSSRAVHFFYAHVFQGGHVGGGYLHFLRSFLVDVPIGQWDDALAREVDACVRAIEVGGPNAEAEERIEEAVSRALGLSAAEADLVRGWAATDANWIARERVREAEARS